MDALWNLASFIVALGILVSIHEYGHFWVARKLGVKVLTFSVGFGRPLLQKIGKDGVRYVLAAIPLGGYVKMLDERETDQEISQEDKPYAFNQKSVWVRMAIVLAGPVANFILAIFLYWFMFVLGINGITTEVGTIPEASIAQQAGLIKGDKIVRVDGEAVVVMHDLTKNIAKRLGEKSQIILTVQREGRSAEQTIVLDISKWQVDDEKPEILHSLGIFHPLESEGIFVGTITSDGPADKAGIEVGDKIQSVNGKPVERWQAMKLIIELLPNKQVSIEVERNGELIPLSVVIGSADENEPNSGFIGIGSPQYMITRQAGLFEAFGLAIDETINMVSLSTKLFIKLISGEISTKSLSGPISIAEGAGSSASIGLVYFISFLAMISVNLGFINLLPIPMLDGGHLLYFVIEAIKGKPLSQKVQEFGLQVGMMLVFALMAIAIFNDISRF